MLDITQDTERQIFSRMQSNEQIMALFDMLRYVRAEIASTKRAVLDMQDDLTTYRRMREQRETPLNTEGKIQAALDSRFNFGIYLRDKVVPGILQLALIALLYLIFSKP
jgi:hypothetical protein